MWEIDNRTPFTSAGKFKYDNSGKNVRIIIVKAGFDILPDGKTKPAAVQPEVIHTPEYNFEPGISSIKYDIDFIIDKPATDIILNGHAHAPGGRHVTRTEVCLKLGPINKTLVVRGDRIWRKGVFGSKSLTIPFVKMPIVYERAHGGIDTIHKKKSKHRCFELNPVGTGFAVKSSSLRGRKVPNIETTKRFKKKVAAGFGVIANNWAPRVFYQGRLDKNNPGSYLKDFDPRYYQQAPVDQQVQGFLKGNEGVELKNLHPDSNLTFNLPGLRPKCQTKFDSSLIEHKLNLHTVIIEPDDNRLLMVWHTAFECHGKEHLIEKTIINL